jgi:hypothetical protein
MSFPNDVTHVIDMLLSDSSVTLDCHLLARQTRELLYARHSLTPGGRDIDDWEQRRIRRIHTTWCLGISARRFFWIPAPFRLGMVGRASRRLAVRYRGATGTDLPALLTLKMYN